ncbi:MAG: FAD-dependent oxidoreductase [Dehalobacterium sp.]
MTKKKIIIIGAGNAGLSAYEILAKESNLCQVTIISEESYLRYCPTGTDSLISDLIGLYPPYGLALSPLLMSGQANADKTLTEDLDIASSDQNQIIFKNKATKIMPEEKKVLLEDGNALDYDALIICTGAKSADLPIVGKEAGNVFGLRTQSEIERIMAAAKKSKGAMVIGAGAAGIETALRLSKQGLSVSIVEKADQVLPESFDKEAAKIIQSLLEEKGVDFYLGTGIAGINRDEAGNVSSVTLVNEKEINCNLIVIAVGAESNTDIVKDSGIEVNRGILVNDRMETNCKNIYAAGDVAEARGFLLNQKTVLPILADAKEQGRIAAMNTLKLDAVPEYEGGLPVNLVTLNGNTMFSMGEVIKTDAYIAYTYASPEKSDYLKLVFDNDQLIGAIGVNHNLPVGIIRKMILNRIHLNHFKDMLIEKPNVPDVWINTALAKLWQTN